MIREVEMLDNTGFCNSQYYDPVNKPFHYTSGNYECIDVMIDTFGNAAVENFCLLNAFKYLFRQEKKGGVEDVEKALWYLNKYIELKSEDATEE